ncbi:hypothetical protein [Ensifer sp. 4252]|uniref:hypothetical protein n=1 Tax=Ensifer sp. 4252 TaxID=3373915 RepID=UPI003D1D3317
MSRDMKPANFWDWLGPFLVITAFIAYLCLSSADEVIVCRKDDMDCFREWVSALSGWFAGLAAVVTVLFIVQQIRSADRNHLDLVELELEPKFACARRAAYHAAVVKGRASHLIGFFGESGSWRTGEKLNYREELQKLREYIMDAAFEEFERTVGTPEPYSLQTIRTMIDIWLERYEPDQVEFQDSGDFPIVRSVAKQVALYCDMCIWRARDYTARWEAIIGREINPMREDGYPV